MRRGEYEAKRKALQAELAALEKEPIEEDYNRWTPKTGEIYYRLDEEGDVFEERWSNDVGDKYYYEIGNCFRTTLAAANAFNTLKVIAELKEFADPANIWNGTDHHYYLAYNYDTENILILDEQAIRTHDIYFRTAEIAEAAIEAVGKDRIKKHYLGIF